MKYFLAKTEPGNYSIDDLERDRKTVWDGVVNSQAVRAIRQMQPGEPQLGAIADRCRRPGPRQQGERRAQQGAPRGSPTLRIVTRHRP